MNNNIFLNPQDYAPFGYIAEQLNKEQRAAAGNAIRQNVAVHRPGYLDFARYNDFTLLLEQCRLVLPHYANPDNVAFHNLANLKELFNRHSFCDVLRISAQRAPAPLIAVLQTYHWHDLSIQAMRNPFHIYERSHNIRQQQMLLYPALIARINDAYPSYEQEQLRDLQGLETAQQDRAQEPGVLADGAAPEMHDAYVNGYVGNQVHRVSHIMGIRLETTGQQIDDSFVQIPGFHDMVNDVNEITQQQSWQQWENNAFIPWLNEIGRIPREELTPEQRSARLAEDRTFGPLITQMRNAWARKSHVRLNAIETSRIFLSQNSSWQQVRKSLLQGAYSPTNYNAVRIIDGLRMLAYSLLYTRSTHFQQWPNADKLFFYHTLTIMLPDALSACAQGFFERMTLVAYQVLRYHNKYTNGLEIRLSHNLLEDVLSPFLCSEEGRATQIVGPTPLLQGIFLRTLSECQRSQCPDQRINLLASFGVGLQGWDALWPHLRQYFDNNPNGLEQFQRELAENQISWAQGLNDLLNFSDSIKELRILAPAYRYTGEEQDLIERFPVGFKAQLDDLQPAEEGFNQRWEALTRMPLPAVFVQELEVRARLISIVRKNDTLQLLKQQMRRRLQAMSPQRSLISADVLREALMLAIDQKQLAAALQQMERYARGLTNQQTMRSLISVKILLLEQARNATTFEDVDRFHASEGFQRALKYCDHIAQPQPDTSWELELERVIKGQPVPLESSLGTLISQMQQESAYAGVFTHTQARYYSQQALPKPTLPPSSLHDFLRHAHRLTGLTGTHLQLILATLGRSCGLNEQEDPFDGEHRSLHRGLQMLMANYESLYTQGWRAHSILPTDDTIRSSLLNWHARVYSSTRRVRSEDRLSTFPYCAALLRPHEQAYDQRPLSEISASFLQQPEQLLALLETAQVDLVEQLLLRWHDSTQERECLKSNQYAVKNMLQKILNWSHTYQYYRLFQPVLNLSIDLDLTEQVINKDLLFRLYFRTIGKDFSDVLSELREHQALSVDTVKVLALTEISPSYLTALLDNWEQFQWLLEQNTFASKLPKGPNRAQIAKNMQQELISKLFDLGFWTRCKDLFGINADNHLFAYKMIKIAYPYSAEIALSIFKQSIAQHWQNLTHEELLSFRLPQTIMQCLNNPSRNSQANEQDPFIIGVCRWVRENHHFGPNDAFDLNQVSEELFKRRILSTHQIKMCHKVCQELGLRRIIVPDFLIRDLSYQKLAMLWRASNGILYEGPSVRWDYPLLSGISMRTYIYAYFFYYRGIFEDIVSKIKRFFGYQHPQEQHHHAAADHDAQNFAHNLQRQQADENNVQEQGSHRSLREVMGEAIVAQHFMPQAQFVRLQELEPPRDLLFAQAHPDINPDKLDLSPYGAP